MGRSSRLSAISWCGLTLPLALAVPAFAQTAAPRPPQLPTREEVTPPAPTGLPAPTASIDARGAIAAASCPFETSSIRLKLTAVHFTRPDGSPLQPAIADTLSRVVTPTGDLPIKVVCDVRDEANAALRRDGWVASVQIPPQSIATGELRLQVVTARITEIRVRGTPGPYRAALEGRLQRLRALDPLNQRDAERELLLAGDLPGLDIQLSLRPAGTQPGDVIGDLLITYRPFALLGNIQNFNSRALGRVTGYARAEAYGLTGLSDLAYVGASATSDFKKQIIVQGGYTVGLDEAGTRFGPRIVYAWSRPDLGALDLKTNTLITGFDLTRPIKRSLGMNIRADMGFDYVDQSTNVQSGGINVPLNLDKLRVLFVGLAGDALKRRRDGLLAYSISGDVEVRKGLAIFDATPHGAITGTGALPSRVDGNSRATVIRADLAMTVALDKIFSVSGAARGQWASDALLNYEEFSIGNLTLGRGYDPGSNSGDRAIGVRGEAAARVPLTSRDVTAQVFGFYDSVWFTNLDRGSTEVDRHIRSFGGGLRMTLFNKLLAEAIFAHPMDKALTIDNGPPPNRVLLSLTAKFDARAR